MKKKIAFLALLIYLLTSCQQEIFRPVNAPVNVVPEKVVAAIVITNAAQNEFDSIVYRYLSDKTREVHYRKSGDSVTRTYHYDAAGRLAKLEDENALYFTNNNVARSISFQYNSSGQLIKTLTDFNTVSGVLAYYNHTVSGNGKKIIGYDTSYITSSYNLNWANRIIYNTLSADNYLVYDSSVFFNNTTGETKTLVSDFTYDADKNATGIRQYTYQDGQLSEWGTVSATYDRPAPIYEGLRKKLFRNLANWYEVSSVSQDDNYRFFSIPGHMYKNLSYSGYSSNGGIVPLTVLKGVEYKNEYNNDLLLKSIVTFSVTGQGNIHYVNDIRYYYK
jgi:hypothetical protein